MRMIDSQYEEVKKCPILNLQQKSESRRSSQNAQYGCEIRIKTATRKYKEAVEAGNKELAQPLLKDLISLLDKAAGKKLIHKTQLREKNPNCKKLLTLWRNQEHPIRVLFYFDIFPTQFQSWVL